MPIRSLFGLSDSAKNTRRVELEKWLVCAIQFSQHEPWMRSYINCFLQVPHQLLVPVTAVAAAELSAEEYRQSYQSSGGNIQVIMPTNIRAGELLELDVNGETFYIPAPDNVAPGAVFPVTLPRSELVIATEVHVVGESLDENQAENQAQELSMMQSNHDKVATSSANPF
jgi:hypothetical protein